MVSCHKDTKGHKDLDARYDSVILCALCGDRRLSDEETEGRIETGCVVFAAKTRRARRGEGNAKARRRKVVYSLLPEAVRYSLRGLAMIDTKGHKDLDARYDSVILCVLCGEIRRG